MATRTPRGTQPPAYPSAVTTFQPFSGQIAKADGIFAVQAGAPALNTLEQALGIIDIALRESTALANELDHHSCWATSYMLEMAYALTLSALKGLGEVEQ